MKKIVQMKIDQYNSITNGNKKWVIEELENQEISILKGFINNIGLVNDFYDSYYNKDNKRIVLCGINPGRFGAGKTGVPFLDYKSLSELIPSIRNNDCELSAQFIFSVIIHFGYKYFFDNVYLTNISWFGFTKKNNNFNYYELDESLQKEFLDGFIDEMDVVKPVVIVPLSKDVEKSLKKLKSDGKLEFKIAKKIPHPYYYSNFPTRYENGLNKYIEVIEELI